METTIKLKDAFTSLDEIVNHVKSNSSFEASKEYDHWDLRTDANGQMEQCVVIKKSNMHGVKAYFTNDNTLKIDYIIPSKLMNAYFGKSQKAHRNIIELVAGGIKNTLLAGSQKKAFNEIVQSFDKIKI